MDSTIEAMKLSFGVIIAGAIYNLGGVEKHMCVLFFLIGIDTIVGWVVAKHNGVWTSSKARWGFIGKIVELVFIEILFLIDWCLDINFLKYIGIYYFGLCEIASVIESFSKINKNVPGGLADVLNDAKSSFSTIFVKKIKSILDKAIEKE